MKDIYKFLLLSFAGGIFLQTIDVFDMIVKEQQWPDIYHMVGLFGAGIMGIGGYFVGQATNIRSSFLCGISSPQIFHGGVKGLTVLSMMFSPISPAYAQQDSVIVDKTIKIVVVNNTGDRLWIEQDKIIYQLREDTTYTAVTSKRNVLLIRGKRIPDQNIIIDTLDLKKQVWIEIDMKRIKKRKIIKSLLRGITAKNQEAILNDAVVKVWQK